MKNDTKLIHSGRKYDRTFHIVNPPVFRASTILYANLEEFQDRALKKYDGPSYGIHGTPTNMALADAVAQLEGGHQTQLTSSGLSAVTYAMLAFLSPGDHILVTDSVYEPTRNFCNGILPRFGVEVSYYNPCCGAEIEKEIRPNTKAIFLESPGSMTFEVQDIPAITSLARERKILTILDNTWSAGYFFKAFEHGVDVSLQALSKYIGGHADLLLGSITLAAEENYRKVKDTVDAFGDCTSPDVCSMALRGLRTLEVRLKRCESNALEVARWLQERPEVSRVLHPALPTDPGHALWKRDFSGACGLFGFVMNSRNPKGLAAMIDGFRLFGLGASWGGFESLVMPGAPHRSRTATTWEDKGHVVRLHIGLENPADLIADLSDGFQRYAGVS